MTKVFRLVSSLVSAKAEMTLISVKIKVILNLEIRVEEIQSQTAATIGQEKNKWGWLSVVFEQLGQSK